VATLKDIASLAGVPLSTVSYVLNRKGKVIKEKHKRILKIAKELNYVPNQKAISLVSGRANNIGIILPQYSESIFNDSFFAEVLYRLSVSLSKENNGLTLYSCIEDDIDSLNQYVSNGNTDGIIWYMSKIPDEIKETIKRRNIPFVIIIHKDEDMNYLAIDDYSGQLKALTHLHELEHRKILFLSSGDSSIRQKAYLDFIQDKHLNFQKVLHSTHSEISTYSLMDHYLSENGMDFTAIAAETDVMAFGALQALSKWNIKVPEQVSLIGYDDIPLASKCNPPLTTVHQSIVQMVEDALGIIFDILDNEKKELTQKVYVHEVVTRNSTAICRD